MVCKKWRYVRLLHAGEMALHRGGKMITLLLIAYAFMAGMTTEYSHTRQKELGYKTHINWISIIAGIAWPYTIWRISR